MLYACIFYIGYYVFGVQWRVIVFIFVYSVNIGTFRWYTNKRTSYNVPVGVRNYYIVFVNYNATRYSQVRVQQVGLPEAVVGKGQCQSAAWPAPAHRKRWTCRALLFYVLYPQFILYGLRFFAIAVFIWISNFHCLGCVLHYHWARSSAFLVLILDG